ASESVRSAARAAIPDSDPAFANGWRELPRAWQVRLRSLLLMVGQTGRSSGYDRLCQPAACHRAAGHRSGDVALASSAVDRLSSIPASTEGLCRANCLIRARKYDRRPPKPKHDPTLHPAGIQDARPEHHATELCHSSGAAEASSSRQGFSVFENCPRLLQEGFHVSGLEDISSKKHTRSARRGGASNHFQRVPFRCLLGSAQNQDWNGTTFDNGSHSLWITGVVGLH